MDIVQKIANKLNKKAEIPRFTTGDTVGVYVKVKEGEKERIQLFKGVVIKQQGRGTTRSFTVRKMSSGVGVERIFPVSSPSLDRVELIARGKVRRSRLFFLRKLRGKAARLDSELVVQASEKGKASKAAAAAEEKAPE